MSNSRSLESVFHLVHMLKREMYKQIGSLDLNIAPMHIRVLKIMGKKPVCTAIDIAHFLDRDKAQVTRLLNSLIDMELIKKVPSLEDKRSQRLLISEKGADIPAITTSIANSAA
ncbi:hypothetical protein VIRA109638_16750 [Vibrio rarus]